MTVHINETEAFQIDPEVNVIGKIQGSRFLEKSLLRGELRYTVYKNGVPIEKFDDKNLILFGTRIRLAHLITGDESVFSLAEIFSGLAINKIAIGTNGDIPTGHDTVIIDPFTKTFERFDYPDIGHARFFWKINEDEANGKAIREFGLLTQDNTLFARRFRDKPINKDSDISIDGEWIIAFG